MPGLLIFFQKDLFNDNIVDNGPCIHIPIFIQGQNGHDATKASLTPLLKANGFGDFCVSVSTNSINCGASAISSNYKNLITGHNEFNKVVKLINRLPANSSRLVISKLLCQPSLTVQIFLLGFIEKFNN